MVIKERKKLNSFYARYRLNRKPNKIKIKGTPIIAGRNYANIEIINPQGEHEGFCVPISVISKQIFKGCKVSTM